jgi:molybdate-binding protein/DNA-binding transcriptional regulator YhcF (GntR family)
MIQTFEQFQIDKYSQLPIYQQIADQIKQLIASQRLHQGEHLPPIRRLAQFLEINPGTVVRAYSELEREGILISKGRGGTLVAIKSGDPNIAMRRQLILSNMVSNQILEMLSLGYSPEELEVAFYTYLARWREERNIRIKEPYDKNTGAASTSTLVLVVSHDLALNVLVDLFKNKNPGIDVNVTYAGSLGGLIALQEDRAHIAGIHLLDEETGEYNYPYIKHVLPGKEVAVVQLTFRIQGLMVALGNPKNLTCLEDLTRNDIVFVNRYKSTGTRVLLDLKLRQHHIMPSEINGYDQEVDTHLTVASAIAQGKADVGLGIEAAARTFSLGFIPLYKERYDLVIPMNHYKRESVSALLEIVKDKEFKELVTSIGGYDIIQTGSINFYK